MWVLLSRILTAVSGRDVVICMKLWWFGAGEKLVSRSFSGVCGVCFPFLEMRGDACPYLLCGVVPPVNMGPQNCTLTFLNPNAFKAVLPSSFGLGLICEGEK